MTGSDGIIAVSAPPFCHPLAPVRTEFAPGGWPENPDPLVEPEDDNGKELILNLKLKT